MSSLAADEALDRKTFDAFRRLIYDESGITLSDQKVALVRSRIAKRMRSLGIETHADYLHLVQNDATGEELTLMLDAISTNVTHFFREGVHFDILAQHLTSLHKAGERRFRLWSAASSSGEEPYTIAITAANTLADPGDFRILATDISTRMLAACQAATYGLKRLEHVPRHLLDKHFDRLPAREGDEGPRHQVRENLRRMVTVRRLNLAKPPFPMKGPFHAVFCRNVMIYFDMAVRKALLADITRLLAPGGLLFVGHAESLTGMCCNLRNLRPSVYVKDGA